jgi:hypothetical protein
MFQVSSFKFHVVELNRKERKDIHKVHKVF